MSDPLGTLIAMDQRTRKLVTRTSLSGQAGISLIEKIVLEMGCRWDPTGPTEVGIDGYIELVDVATREALGVVVAVQSKTVLWEFDKETEGEFEYLCRAKDLDYWMRGNMPVVLIVSRPSTDEAYWIPIKSYFDDPERRVSRKVNFDKKLHRFDSGAYKYLRELACPEDSGFFLGEAPRDEKLYSNLIPVRSWPSTIYVASTEHRRPRQVYGALREHGCEGLSGEWFLSDERIFGFVPLDQHPWTLICDEGSVERFDAREWSESDDPAKRRDFVRLLNRSLIETLQPAVRYHAQADCFYWSAPKNGRNIKGRYQSAKKTPSLSLFHEYTSRARDGRVFKHYRHLAFRGAFRSLDHQWFLELTPTYVFTADGRQLDRFHANRLKKIKELEKNRAVLSQVLFWADRLSRGPDLLGGRRSSLEFGRLATFDVPFGIDDAAWVPPTQSDPDARQLTLNED